MSCLKLVKALLFNLLLLVSPIMQAQEYYDPFYLLANSEEGKQLLEIIDNADYDVELAQQQLIALKNIDVDQRGLEYKVARMLAEIEVSYHISDFDNIAQILIELQQLASKPEHQWILALYYERQANLALRQGKFLKGHEDANRAIEIAASLNFQQVVAQAKRQRAIFSGKLGRGSEAFADFEDALHFFEQAENLKRVTAIYSNLVTFYLDRQEYQKALEASDKAVAIFEQLPRKSIRIAAVNYINRAIALSYLGLKEQELEAYIKAQEYALKSDDAELLASVYANLSDYFLRNENYTLAIERAKRCNETATRINNINLIAICYLNQGLASVHSEQTEQGLALLENAHALAIQQHMESTLIDIYKAYIEAYQIIGDHQTANQWLEKRYQLLLKQVKHDQDNSFIQMEENFKQVINDRKRLHESMKNDMLANILGQEELVKRLWLGLALLGAMVVIALVVIVRLKRKINKHNY